MIAKTYKYFLFKINSSLSRVIIVLVILTIYQLGMILNLFTQHIKFNFYDLLISGFGYLSLFYCILLYYIIITYNVCARSNFHKYLYLKFKSKSQVYNANVLIILVIAVILVMLINLIYFLQSFLNVSFDNTWSPYFCQTMTGNVNLFFSEESLKILTSKLTPLSYTIYSEILVVLYLFFLGLFFLVSDILIKKRAVSFILVLLLNFVNMVLDSTGGIIGRLSFTSNIYFITASTFELKNNLFILVRILYWLVLISIFYFTGKILTKKIDYRFDI